MSETVGVGVRKCVESSLRRGIHVSHWPTVLSPVVMCEKAGASSPRMHPPGGTWRPGKQESPALREQSGHEVSTELSATLTTGQKEGPSTSRQSRHACTVTLNPVECLLCARHHLNNSESCPPPSHDAFSHFIERKQRPRESR